MKDIAITEHVTFSFSAQAYNLFNHTNFDQPVADIANPQFGSSIAAVGPPTSLLGSFVGAGSSPRFVEVKGSFDSETGGGFSIAANPPNRGTPPEQSRKIRLPEGRLSCLKMGETCPSIHIKLILPTPRSISRL